MSNNQHLPMQANQPPNDQAPPQDSFVPMNMQNNMAPQPPSTMPVPPQSSIPLGQPHTAQMIPDPSNPYNYSVNQATPTSGLHEPISAAPGGTSDKDPQLTKITSSFSFASGFVQEKLGSIIGSDDMVHTGKSTQDKANQEWEDADNKRKSGVPSRIGGEYESIMGTIMQKVGYVAGDPEMEARAALRAQQGREEVSKVTGDRQY
ncbi:hypothetical protein INT44_002436 [Umbelopsis vinacea]|uniref:Uncharacterized protein n=1 Tax=Umbelopsis vinacea TaxID=44442 RepID=A0A8H7Q4C4_9FUNG|nr:hypothetical protein INT44_002436 [Umbelopsis vinacea]